MQTPISSSKFRAGGDEDDDEDHVVCCHSFLFFNETGETKNTGKSTASSRKSLDRKAKPATRNESCFTISVHVVAFTIINGTKYYRSVYVHVGLTHKQRPTMNLL